MRSRAWASDTARWARALAASETLGPRAHGHTSSVTGFGDRRVLTRRTNPHLVAGQPEVTKGRRTPLSREDEQQPRACPWPGLPEVVPATGHPERVGRKQPLGPGSAFEEPALLSQTLWVKK